MTSEPHMNNNSISNEAIRKQAFRWVLRQREDAMAEQDWVEFTDWLEANPAHLKAYDAALEADEDLAAVAAELSGAENDIATETYAANDDGPEYNRQYRWAGFGAVAAAILAIFIFWPSAQAPQFETFQTEIGEIRKIAVGPDIMISMNGNTKLAVNKDSATVKMLRGEATYNVDSKKPGALRVEIDDLVLVDYGTIFNVVRDDQLLRVAVTQGAVIIGPDKEKLHIKTGRQVQLNLKERKPVSSKIAAENILAWQNRQLAFEDRQVHSVIGDLERNLGTTIKISDRLRNQQITGVVSLANDEATVVGDVAAVLGGKSSKTETGWLIQN